MKLQFSHLKTKQRKLFNRFLGEKSYKMRPRQEETFENFPYIECPKQRTHKASIRKTTDCSNSLAAASWASGRAAHPTWPCAIRSRLRVIYASLPLPLNFRCILHMGLVLIALQGFAATRPRFSISACFKPIFDTNFSDRNNSHLGFEYNVQNDRSHTKR